MSILSDRSEYKAHACCRPRTPAPPGEGVFCQHAMLAEIYRLVDLHLLSHLEGKRDRPN